MVWLRRQRGRIGGLAVFAIALQLVLSFGHVHAEDFAGSYGQAAVAEAPANVPFDGDTDRHQACAICTTIHIAATSLLPVVPQIAEAAERPAELAANPAGFAVARERPRLFQARAPPQL